MRVFREPCYFAEAVYLLYYFVNEVSYEEEFARICKCYCRKADEEEEGMMRRIPGADTGLASGNGLTWTGSLPSCVITLRSCRAGEKA